MTCEYMRVCVQRCSERFKSTLSGYGCGNGAYENGPGLRAECAAGPSCGPRGLARTDLLWNPPHTCFLPLTPCRPTSRLAPHSSCTRAAQPQSDAPGPGSPARPEQHGAAANCMRSDRRTGVRRLQLAQSSRKRPQHSSGRAPARCRHWPLLAVHACYFVLSPRWASDCTSCHVPSGSHWFLVSMAQHL